MENARERIVSFIADLVDDAGSEGAVLGLSGGIDSTLTAHLAVEALGEDGLHGITMPAEVNDPDVMSDAERVAHDLGIEYDVVEIQPIAESVFDAFPEAADDRMAAGNVYVRTRAVLNYFVANAENRIVLGTGNRAEAMTGYFTKYGDQAVDCNPIGNLYKQQVRQLAAHVGVPRDLVMQEPTAGMWEGQTDAAEMGLDYDTVDAILAVHVDGGSLERRRSANSTCRRRPSTASSNSSSAALTNDRCRPRPSARRRRGNEPRKVGRPRETGQRDSGVLCPFFCDLGDPGVRRAVRTRVYPAASVREHPGESVGDVRLAVFTRGHSEERYRRSCSVHLHLVLRPQDCFPNSVPNSTQIGGSRRRKRESSGHERRKKPGTAEVRK